MTSAIRIIERVECEADFNAILKLVRQLRGMSHEDVEELVNLTTGHVGKIENGDKTWGKQILRFEGPAMKVSQTVPWMLEALGLRMLIVDQDTAEALAEPKMKLLERPHKVKETLFERPTSTRIYVRWTRRPD